MTCEEQLEKWVVGISEHNRERDECCPDFSCCQSKYKASEDERRTFRDRPELRDSMLMGFLGAALHADGLSEKVHIINESMEPLQ
jgi:hypothetical protein